MTSPKWLNPQISMGNILTIAATIIGLAMGWQTIVGVTQTNAKDVASVTRRVDAMEINIATIIKEFNSDRLDTTRILTELQSDMRYTRIAVDEIRNSQAK